MSHVGGASGPPQGFAVPLHQATVLPAAPGQPPNVLYAPQGAVGPASTSAPRLAAALPPRLTLSAGMAGAPGLGSFSMASPAMQGPSALQAVQQIYGGAASNGMAQQSPIRKAPQGLPQPKGGVRKQCNCKNSRCLKLYCECFASGRYCDNCNCINCFNNRESEVVRQSAVEAILERNPNAFRPKIQPNEVLDAAPTARTADGAGVRHTKGCNCKKSFCLKKYCECFQAGIYCSDMCKCIDCKNFDGSDARSQVLSTQELMAAHQHGGGIKRQRVTVPLIPSPMGLQAQQHHQQQHYARPQQQQQQQQAALQLMPMLPNGMGLQRQQQQQQQSMPLSAPQLQMQALSALQAGAAAQQISTPAAVRNPRLDVVNEVVKQGVIEELCRLLILVADEEADKVQQRVETQQQQQEQRQQQEQQQEQRQQGAQSITVTANGTDGGADAGVTSMDVDHGNGNGIADQAAATAATAEPPAAAAAAAAGTAAVAADGVGRASEAAGTSRPAAAPDASMEAADEQYAAQERVVLQEFQAILQKIISTAEKKAGGSAGKEAVAAAAGASNAGGPGVSTSGLTGVSNIGPPGASNIGPLGASNFGVPGAGSIGVSNLGAPAIGNLGALGNSSSMGPPIVISSALPAVMNGAFAPPAFATSQPSTTQTHMQQLMASAAAAAAAAGGGGPQMSDALPLSQQLQQQQQQPQVMNQQPMQQLLYPLPMPMPGKALAPGGLRFGSTASAPQAGLRLLPMPLGFNSSSMALNPAGSMGFNAVGSMGFSTDLNPGSTGFNPVGNLAPIAPLTVGMQPSTRPALPPLTVAGVAESERQQAVAMQAAATAVLNVAGAGPAAPAAVAAAGAAPQGNAAVGQALAGGQLT